MRLTTALVSLTFLSLTACSNADDASTGGQSSSAGQAGAGGAPSGVGGGPSSSASDTSTTTAVGGSMSSTDSGTGASTSTSSGQMAHDPCTDPSGTVTWAHGYVAAPSNPPISTAGVSIAPAPNGRVVALQNTQWYSGEGESGYTPETAVFWLSAEDGSVLATEEIDQTFGSWATDLSVDANGFAYVASGAELNVYTAAPKGVWSTTSTADPSTDINRLCLDRSAPALYTLNALDFADIEPVMQRLDPSSGAVVWKVASFDLPATPAAMAAVMGEVRMVNGDGSIVRVDASTGTLLAPIAGPGIVDRPAVLGAAIDATGVMYAVMYEVPEVGGTPTQAYVFAEDASGALLWSTPLSSSFVDYDDNLTIALAGSTVLVGLDTQMFRVDPTSGAVTPWLDLQSIGASSAAHVRKIAFDGACGVYVTGDDGTDCDQTWMTGCMMVGLRVRL